MQLGALVTVNPPTSECLQRVTDSSTHLALRQLGRASLLVRAPIDDQEAIGDALTARSPAPDLAHLAVVADARIDNRAELLTALGLAVAEGAALTDAALIASAYARWGTACAGRMVGDFAFVLWDEHQRRLVAACDPMGMRTLHYARRGAMWALASTAEWLLALLGEAPRIDRHGLAGWLVGRPLANQAVLSGVTVLPAGHSLVIENDQLKTQRFWDLDPNATLRLPSVAQYAEHLCELLSRCVADRLPPNHQTVACQLSGGMDSTSVVALAARQLPDAGRRLLAVSHGYAPTTNCDESGLIEQTARHIGIRRHLWLPVQAHTALAYTELYPPTLDSPGTLLSPRYLDELQQVRRQGARVLLTGSGGDEMTWGHSLSYGQRLRRGELGVVAEVLAGARELELPLLPTLLNLFVRPWVPARVRRLRRRLAKGAPWPDWMPARTAKALDLAHELYSDGARRFRNPALQARYSALVNSSTYHSVRSYQAVGERTGVAVRHPFFDRRLAEFSFAIPHDLWLRERYPKWLMRRAMAGRLPQSVTWNRHKVVFDQFFARLLKDQRPHVRGILSHPGLQELGLVDNRRLLAAFDIALDRDPPTVSVDLLHALMAQVWFQRHAEMLGY